MIRALGTGLQARRTGPSWSPSLTATAAPSLCSTRPDTGTLRGNLLAFLRQVSASVGGATQRCAARCRLIARSGSLSRECWNLRVGAGQLPGPCAPAPTAVGVPASGRRGTRMRISEEARSGAPRMRGCRSVTCWSGVSGPKNTSRASADVFTRQVRSPARRTASSARGDEAWSARRRWRGNGEGGGDEHHRPGRCAQRAGATSSSVLLLSGSNGDGK
jgi:hypothetical protein